MVGLVYQALGGIRPKVDPRLLPANAAQKASNCKLWSGSIQAIRKPFKVSGTFKGAGCKSMYRLNDAGTDYWLHWLTDVNVARGPIAGDTSKRTFYTGDGEPRVTNAALAHTGAGQAYPLTFYAMGLPRPAVAPVVAPPAGSTVTRSYVYTFVDAWGEESGPSPATTATGVVGTWTLSGMDTAPANAGNVVGATSSSGTVTVYTAGPNWIKKGHVVTVASVTGMTDLNAKWTVTDGKNISYHTTNRARSANVATLTLTSVAGLSVGQTIYVSGVGGVSYNGTFTISSISIVNKTISYANVAADEASVADTGGRADMCYFNVSKTTAQSYTSGGTWTREANYNTAGSTQRIYRTLTTAGSTQYQLVKEQTAAATFSDPYADSELGEVISTTDYDLPPGDMKGLVEMTNGIFAGFAGNEICFSEPYKVYAWPVKYRLSTFYDIAGVGVTGDGDLIVATSAVPYFVSGIHPESMSIAGLAKDGFPCLSKRSVVSGPWGVAWATDRGIALASRAGVDLLTKDLYDRKIWNADVNYASMISFVHDERYYGFWTDSKGNGRGLILDYNAGDGLLTENNEKISGAWTDPETGIAYVVNTDNNIAEWDSASSINQIYQWKSKKTKIPKPVNFGAVKLDASFSLSAAEVSAITAENNVRTTANVALIGAIGTNKTDPLDGAFASRAFGAGIAFGGNDLRSLLPIQAQGFTFNFYDNDTLKASFTISDNGIRRLPVGYKTDTPVVEALGTQTLHSIKIAETARELNQA